MPRSDWTATGRDELLRLAEDLERREGHALQMLAELRDDYGALQHMLTKVLVEHRQLSDNLAATQARCTELLDQYRDLKRMNEDDELALG